MAVSRTDAGEAVQHRDAEQEERRGERAQQEVLHRRFLGEQPPAAGQAAQQVERQRQHFQRHEHGEQVVGGGEQQHAADREQGQRVDLGVADAGFQPLALFRAAGDGGGLRGERDHVMRGFRDQHDADKGQHDDRAPDEQRRPVDGDGSLRGHVSRAAVAEDSARRGHHDRRGERRHQAAESQHQVDGAAPGPGHERLHQHPGHGHAEDQQHRRELAVLDVRRGDGGGHGEDPGHRAPPFCWGAAAGCGGTGSVECTWTRVWCTAGLITLSTGWG